MSLKVGYVIFLATVLHIIYLYQSVNQRSILRKEVSSLIEKYKRNKDLKKAQLAVNEAIKMREMQAAANWSIMHPTMKSPVGLPDKAESIGSILSHSNCLDLDNLVEEAELVINNALETFEKEMETMVGMEIQVSISDFVDNDEIDGLGSLNSILYLESKYIPFLLSVIIFID